jgi:hypothetical protein
VSNQRPSVGRAVRFTFVRLIVPKVAVVHPAIITEVLDAESGHVALMVLGASGPERHVRAMPAKDGGVGWSWPQLKTSPVTVVP